MQMSHRAAGAVGLLAAFSVTALFACGNGSSSPPSGQSGDFAGRVALPGGRALYLECRGKGRPTVILESGLRNRADVWRVAGADDASPDAVFPKLAGFTRVCAYDRPGTTLGTDQFSRSDAVPMPRSTADAVNDLHQLLAAADVPGPYVMVGHSTGGLIVRLYAASHPDQVVGLVLVDAIAETMQTLLTPEQWAQYNRLLLVAPPPELAGYRDLETIDFDVSFAQMRAATDARPLPPLPFAVLSKGQRFALPPDLQPGLGDAVERAWQASQGWLAALLPDTRHVVVADSSHYIQVERPQVVVDAVEQVVDAVRD
jgi:pimeloyl-ACP methyl ester carboxylesterase